MFSRRKAPRKSGGESRLQQVTLKRRHVFAAENERILDVEGEQL